MKYKKIISLILVFTLILNFIIEVKTQAVGLTISGIYGASKALELILFILAAATVGVKFNALEEANAMYDNYRNWGSIEPPPENDWKNALKQLLTIGTLSTVVGGIITNIRDFFQSEGAVEGENISPYGQNYTVGDMSIWIDYYPISTTVVRPMIVSNQGITSYFSKPNGEFWDIGISQKSEFKYTVSTEKNNQYTIFQVRSYRKSNNKLVASGNVRLLSSISYDTEEQELNYIKYNVEPNSLILSGRNPSELPEWYQPNLLDIVDTKEKTLATGENITEFEGTIDDLIDELIEKTTFEDLKNATSRPSYTMKENQSGTTVIETGQSSETPYPDIEIEPIEDVSQFQGENIGLLKSIVNWLSNIKNEIVNIGDKIDNLVKEEEPKEIDWTPITSVSLTDKFPFSLPWDLKKSISMLASEGKAPVWEIPLVTETIIIDMGEFEEIASIARIFNTLLFIIILIILTRRFI